MELKKFSILPAAIALSLAFAPVALAGPPDHGKGQPDTPKVPTPPAPPTPPNKAPTPTPTPRPTPPSMGGGGSSNDPTIACRIGNRLVYTPTWRQCKQLRASLGFGGHGQGGGHAGGGSVVVGGGFGYAYGGGTYADDGGYSTGGGYVYQPQRVIRYVAMPSRAAQMQMEKRARKAARRAAAAYGGYGYGDGAMIGYGNGVMVGGYGNNVVVNGDVYAGQQVVVRKKRKGKKARRVYVQQPAYGYEYDGSVMVKGGGY